MNKNKQKCPKCERDISTNNFERHFSACGGKIIKKVRGVDFDPNIGFKDGSRQAWNKGLILGPYSEITKKYAEIRKSRNTLDIKSHGAIRRKVIEEQEGKCKSCGLSEWLNQKISLELNHINGINKDNRRNNLEALCPNCHSLTPTWRGKNRNHVYPTSEGAALIRP